MAEAAKKLTPIESEDAGPERTPGEIELFGIGGSVLARSGVQSVTVGNHFNCGFQFEGPVERITELPNGSIRVAVRFGGTVQKGKMVGGKYRYVRFYGGGMFAVESEE
jgi:hypothetical protein